MSHSATFIAYVDESGDEGFRFDAGSSRWFVLSAAVFRSAQELNEVKLIDEVRARINQGRKPGQEIPAKRPLHFRDLRHEQRKFFAHRISCSALRTITILISKPDLASPENFGTGSRLYFYAVRLLVERLSWYCRDSRRRSDTGDGSVALVFSNRASMDYQALRVYLERLETDREAFGYRATPDVVRPDQLSTHTHGRRMGLQIADAVASSHYYAVEPSAYGLTEDGYVRLLLPGAYRHRGQLWGYGVKLFPGEVEDRRRRGEILSDLSSQGRRQK